MKKLVGVLFFGLCAGAFADVRTMDMLPGEHWWGVCNNFGREMPFSQASDFSCDLRLANYSHQSLSFLCSEEYNSIMRKSQIHLDDIHEIYRKIHRGG